jgi:hypothetical protein
LASGSRQFSAATLVAKKAIVKIAITFFITLLPVVYYNAIIAK